MQCKETSFLSNRFLVLKCKVNWIIWLKFVLVKTLHNWSKLRKLPMEPLSLCKHWYFSLSLSHFHFLIFTFSLTLKTCVGGNSSKLIKVKKAPHGASISLQTLIIFQKLKTAFDLLEYWVKIFIFCFYYWQTLRIQCKRCLLVCFLFLFWSFSQKGFPFDARPAFSIIQANISPAPANRSMVLKQMFSNPNIYLHWFDFSNVSLNQTHLLNYSCQHLTNTSQGVSADTDIFNPKQRFYADSTLQRLEASKQDLRLPIRGRREWTKSQRWNTLAPQPLRICPLSISDMTIRFFGRKIDVQSFVVCFPTSSREEYQRIFQSGVFTFRHQYIEKEAFQENAPRLSWPYLFWILY